MAHHRHKREPNARRFSGFRVPQLRTDRPVRPVFLAAPLAVVATVGAVSIGVLSAGGSTVGIAAPDRPEVAAVPIDDLTSAIPRASTLSRGDANRLEAEVPSQTPSTAAPVKKTHVQRLLAPAAVRKAIAGATTRKWTTEPLNLWTNPSKNASQKGTVEAGKRVLLTGRELAGRVEIVWGESQTRWVSTGYLTDQKPFTLGGECTNGTSVPASVSDNVKLVHAAVCAAFPDITTYGTLRNDGEHSQGLAVDIMVSGERGQEVADFVRKYAADLNVDYAIYAQQIWSVERSGEGWRGMEDRGSVTANHFDHVHVTVF